MPALNSRMRSQRAAGLALVLCLAGIGLCAYLEYLHLGLMRGELVGGIACGGTGSAFNCHAVTGSRFGSLLGVPLALWGLVGYLTAAALALAAWRFSDWSERALLSLAGLASLFVLVDLALLVTMLTQIHFLCVLCLITYAINLALLLAAKVGSGQSWSAVLRQGIPSLTGWLLPGRQPIQWAVWLVALIGLAGVWSVNAATLYIARGSPAAFRTQIAQFVKDQEAKVVDVAGDPIHGSPNAPVLMAEFSDFLCPSCQRAWKFNPILLAGHGARVALAFKNYPLDSTCNRSMQRVAHPGACEIAAAVECAHEQGKFWEFHDKVFALGPEYKPERLHEDAAAVGLDQAKFEACRQSGRGMEAVKRDVEEAIRLGVARTPTYYVNGIPIEGAMSPVMFDELLNRIPERK
jgi:protein-disulfide isomerase/uncharacterized membrane protein